MEPPPEPLAAATPLAEAALALARAPHGILPVAAADGAYLGTATARSAAETLADGAHDGADVAAIVHLPVPLTADTDLGTALDALVTADGAGLPVLDPAHRHPTGWITHQGILRALHATAASVPASGARPSPPPSPAHDRKAAPTP
jgi:CIC family chloride channel protein